MSVQGRVGRSEGGSEGLRARGVHDGPRDRGDRDLVHPGEPLWSNPPRMHVTTALMTVSSDSHADRMDLGQIRARDGQAVHDRRADM
jgi:hypothetical protein